MLDTDVSREFVTASFARPGATTAVDAALRLDSQVMLVDDPVKRVDNMTMAWGARGARAVPRPRTGGAGGGLPARAQTGAGRQGRPQGRGPGVVPDEVIDRTKGYFPVPGIRHLEGPMLEMVRDALHAPAARARGLFPPEYVDALLADPNTARTTLGANQLWQLALLEMWLQDKGI
nr:hypothetical protein GCM10020092_024400 [Actinoplanes digitatis]